MFPRSWSLGLVPLFCAGVAVGACSGGSSPPPAGAQGPAPAAAPSDVPGSGAPSAPLAVPTTGQQIVTPEITIQPGEEKFYCYATSIAATEEVAVKRYVSQMTPGSHHMIVFATDKATAPDGTLRECPGMTGFGGGGGTPPVWAYATQQAEGRLDMPEGVGVVLPARQPLIVNMHYLNAGASPLKVQVKVNIETYAKGEDYIPAAAFATYNTGIDIPPNGTQSVEGSCDVPAGAKFFALSTHSHKYTTKAFVSDAEKVVLTTEDWEHPTQGAFTSPFLEFASGKLTYHCDYKNSTSSSIVTGESAAKNEMCMAVGYYFPARKSQICVNSAVVQR